MTLQCLTGPCITVPAPTTVDDDYATPFNAALNVPAPGVLANDSSNGGGALTASLVTSVANGVLSLNANGGLTYTPNTGFSGMDSFTYRAVNSGGPGNVATVRITVASSTTPAAPVGLYVSSIAGNLVTIRWTIVQAGPAPTGFVLEGGLTPGQVLASLPTGSLYPIFSFVAPTGSFYIRLHALNGAIRSSASNEIRLHVNVPVAPSAPAGLVGLVNGSSLALAWTNTFGGGAPASLVLDVTGAFTGSLPIGNVDTFTFAGVPGGSYTFAVRALNAGGSSPASNAVTLAFPGLCSGPPLAPTRRRAGRRPRATP